MIDQTLVLADEVHDTSGARGSLARIGGRAVQLMQRPWSWNAKAWLALAAYWIVAQYRVEGLGWLPSLLMRW
jgi:hypothetical protein